MERRSKCVPKEDVRFVMVSLMLDKTDKVSFDIPVVLERRLFSSVCSSVILDRASLTAACGLNVLVDPSVDVGIPL